MYVFYLYRRFELLSGRAQQNVGVRLARAIGITI
jgi:hypothetical protein